MKKRENKAKNRKNWLIYLILGGFLLEIVKLIFKNRKKLEEFASEEKREIEELKTHKEGFEKFCCDSTSLMKHYFIPHEGNGHKPKILHPKSLVAIILVLFIIKAVVVGSLFLTYPEGARMSEAVISRILELTNIDRQASGLSPLSIDPVLNSSAFAKAEDMVIRNYFSHYTPDGRKPWDFISRDNYRYIYVGENLAMNFSTADSAHRALMASPTHKKNIMNERYQDIGLAMVSGMIDGKETNVLVEMFGSKQVVLPTKPAVAPAPEEAKPEPTPEPVVEVAGEEQEVAPEIQEVAPEVKEIPPVPAEPKVVPPSTSSGQVDVEQTSAQTEEPELIKEPIPVATVEEVAVQEELALAELEQAVPIVSVTKVRDTASRNINILSNILKTVNMVFALAMVLMIVILFINIFIRLEIQHKPVIIQTLLVILFIGSLWYFKFHYLETGLSDVLILSF